MGCTNCGVTMEINSVKIKSGGYVDCYSRFYTCKGNIPEGKVYNFSVGANILNGEIDCGAWEISYLLSMYPHRPRDFVLTAPTEVSVNGTATSLEELLQHTCYIDRIYPLFGGRTPVRKLIERGIRHSGLDCTAEDIKEMFCLDDQRFERPVNAVGNEQYRAMAAVGYSFGKRVFCFPWFSRKRFEATHNNITWLFDNLAKINLVFILPLGE